MILMRKILKNDRCKGVTKWNTLGLVGIAGSRKTRHPYELVGRKTRHTYRYIFGGYVLTKINFAFCTLPRLLVRS